MAAAKQTPRQRLIGLMYLIFLALMALNVSVVVLESFPLINNSIEETNRNFETKVEMVYIDFDVQKAAHGEELVQPFYNEAMHVKSLADSLVNYIRNKRTQMIANINRISMEEAENIPLEDLRRQDDYSFSSRFWLIENNLDPTQRAGGPGTRAYILRDMISNFKNEIDSILASHDQSIKLGLDVEGPFQRGDRTVNWQEFTFDRVISVAVATNLNRIITEIRNAEFDAISMLYDLIHAGDFRFDQVTARVVPQSEIVMTGSRYNADVFVAAIDTRQDPEITVQGIGRIPVSDGVGRISLPATSAGTRTLRGEITVVTPAGVRQSYPFTTQYTVQPPSATVSATNMNVFYTNIPNPVSISAPGIPSGSLRPEISAGNATLTRQPDGTYIVETDQPRQNVTIAVNAMVEGRMEFLDQMEFRVFALPRPEARIAGFDGGRVDRQVLLRAGVLEATMGEDFLFAGVNWRVQSFDMITFVAGEQRSARQTNGSTLTDEMRRFLTDARPNQLLFFRQIRAVGPGGETRLLGDLSFNIN